MKLFLVQHGKAETKETNPLRPLTEQGREDVSKIAEFIKSCLPAAFTICKYKIPIENVCQDKKSNNNAFFYINIGHYALISLFFALNANFGRAESYP